MRDILGINQILDRTYFLYQKNIKSFLGYTAVMLMLCAIMMYGIFFVISIIFVIIFIIGIAITGSGSGNILAGSMGSFNNAIVWAIVIYVGIIVIMIFASSVMKLIAAGPVNAVEAARNRNKITFGEMFTYSFKKMLYVITSTLAYYIVLCGIAIIGVAIYLLNFVAWLQNASIEMNIIVGAFIGFIVCIVSLWFGVKGAFYLQVALCEKKHFFRAITGSFRLVKGQFIRTFGNLFSVILSYFVVYLSLGGLISLIVNFLPMLLQDREGTGIFAVVILIQMAMMLFQFVLSIVITPIQYIAVPLIYFNERNRKYGDDLHYKIDKLIHIQKSVLK
ncbi:MAG: hypothetical protein CVU84_14845 [Firmicutes bacterium HGW-Firmicutes-1]|jgi:hypothetical protein|nr:MAG: hypothetical protein CVU84_14845 [Firmicutes bacterium HGW-Firmicutes-1]